MKGARKFLVIEWQKVDFCRKLSNFKKKRNIVDIYVTNCPKSDPLSGINI